MSVLTHRHGILAQRHVAAGPVTLIEDSFTAPDGTTLTGRTPDVVNTPGDTWAAMLSAMTITGNAATTLATCRYIINSGVSNCRVSAAMRIGTSSARTPRLVFRDVGNVGGYSVSTVNLWLIDAAVGAPGLWTVAEVLNGSYFSRATGAGTIVLSATYQVEVVLNGTSIQLYVDGVLKASFTSSNHLLNTRHGIGTFNAPGVAIDNFKVTTL
jgi:hypothetical protein